MRPAVTRASSAQSRWLPFAAASFAGRYAVGAHEAPTQAEAAREEGEGAAGSVPSCVPALKGGRTPPRFAVDPRHDVQQVVSLVSSLDPRRDALNVSRRERFDQRADRVGHDDDIDPSERDVDRLASLRSRRLPLLRLGERFRSGPFVCRHLSVPSLDRSTPWPKPTGGREGRLRGRRGGPAGFSFDVHSCVTWPV